MKGRSARLNKEPIPQFQLNDTFDPDKLQETALNLMLDGMLMNSGDSSISANGNFNLNTVLQLQQQVINNLKSTLNDSQKVTSCQNLLYDIINVTQQLFQISTNISFFANNIPVFVSTCMNYIQGNSELEPLNDLLAMLLQMVSLVGGSSNSSTATQAPAQPIPSSSTQSVPSSAQSSSVSSDSSNSFYTPKSANVEFESTQFVSPQNVSKKNQKNDDILDLFRDFSVIPTDETAIKIADAVETEIRHDMSGEPKDKVDRKVDESIRDLAIVLHNFMTPKNRPTISPLERNNPIPPPESSHDTSLRTALSEPQSESRSMYSVESGSPEPNPVVSIARLIQSADSKEKLSSIRKSIDSNQSGLGDETAKKLTSLIDDRSEVIRLSTQSSRASKSRSESLKNRIRESVRSIEASVSPKIHTPPELPPETVANNPLSGLVVSQPASAERVQPEYDQEKVYDEVIEYSRKVINKVNDVTGLRDVSKQIDSSELPDDVKAMLYGLISSRAQDILYKQRVQEEEYKRRAEDQQKEDALEQATRYIDDGLGRANLDNHKAILEIYKQYVDGTKLAQNVKIRLKNTMARELEKKIKDMEQDRKQPLVLGKPVPKQSIVLGDYKAKPLPYEPIFLDRQGIVLGKPAPKQSIVLGNRPKLLEPPTPEPRHATKLKDEKFEENLQRVYHDVDDEDDLAQALANDSPAGRPATRHKNELTNVEIQDFVDALSDPNLTHDRLYQTIALLQEGKYENIPDVIIDLIRERNAEMRPRHPPEAQSQPREITELASEVSKAGTGTGKLIAIYDFASVVGLENIKKYPYVVELIKRLKRPTEIKKIPVNDRTEYIVPQSNVTNNAMIIELQSALPREASSSPKHDDAQVAEVDDILDRLPENYTRDEQVQTLKELHEFLQRHPNYRERMTQAQRASIHQISNSQDKSKKSIRTDHRVMNDILPAIDKLVK